MKKGKKRVWIIVFCMLVLILGTAVIMFIKNAKSNTDISVPLASVERGSLEEKVSGLRQFSSRVFFYRFK